MRWSAKIGRFAGIDLFVHATFPLLFIYFGFVYWVQTGTLGGVLFGLALIAVLFLCVVLHEYGHALTARRYGIGTRHITLLPIGGVAMLEKMPKDPRQEIVVALMGPAVNVVIAAALFLILLVTGRPGAVIELGLVQSNFLQSVLFANIILAVFNMIPAFPMDGGRVLRAVLSLRTDRVRATRMAANVGQTLAIGFGILGLFGNPFLILIAVFIWIGAGAEANAAEVEGRLHHQPVQRAMITDFQVLGPHEPLARAIDLTLAGTQKDFPVLEGDRVVGVVPRARSCAACATSAPAAGSATSWSPPPPPTSPPPSPSSSRTCRPATPGSSASPATASSSGSSTSRTSPSSCASRPPSPNADARAPHPRRDGRGRPRRHRGGHARHRPDGGGRQAVAEAAARLAPAGPILVVAGPGNNGGDGSVAARLLADAGRDVALLLAGDPDRLKGDAATAFARWKGPVLPADAPLPEAALVVDALLGAGLDRDLAGPMAGSRRRDQRPSRARPRRRRPLRPRRRHRPTPRRRRPSRRHRDLLPLQARPPALPRPRPLRPGRARPDRHPRDRPARPRHRHLGERAPALVRFPDAARPVGHKYSRGHALVLSGGPTRTGAARLTAGAALRAGAGLVTVASPSAALAVNAAHLTAIMLRPCDDADALAAILADHRFTAAALGPGLSEGPDDRRASARSSSPPSRPRPRVVLDADALTAWQDDPAPSSTPSAPARPRRSSPPTRASSPASSPTSPRAPIARSSTPPARPPPAPAPSSSSRAPTPSSPPPTAAPRSTPTPRPGSPPPAPATSSPASPPACSPAACPASRPPPPRPGSTAPPPTRSAPA
jgi:Zn-dependent protease